MCILRYIIAAKHPSRRAVHCVFAAMVSKLFIIILRVTTAPFTQVLMLLTLFRPHSCPGDHWWLCRHANLRGLPWVPPWSCQWAQPQDAGGHAHALLHGWKPFSVSVTLPRFTTPASFGLDRQLGTYSVPSSAPRRSGPGAGESIPTRRSRGSRENGEHARVNVHGQQHRGCERLRRAADL